MTTLVMAAHGARNPEWDAVLDGLAGRVRRIRPGLPARLAFLELSDPPLDRVLAEVRGPVVVVPLLLAGGYHVHIDLPEVIARTRPDAVVAGPLGPHPLLTDVLARRLAAAGLRPRDAVILGAAGSSDPAALAAVRAAARLLSVRLSRPVTAAFASAGRPGIAEAVAGIGAGPAPRTVVASYLLAPGLFHTRLAESGADVVSAPLGVDDDLARLVWHRYDEARQGSSRNSRTMASAASGRDGSESAPVKIS
ncbi:sirohydrochlorin chelatase [Herbidospora daliensis]|uniref:sirohydrochlorin chelatase n=1 Tax=Herbidospora daliensis TaxID=295585 RepID=UPI0012FB886E|nr:sirohydrochlorin chelatase [Herbidospora daliensis]